MRYHHHITKLLTIATLAVAPLTLAACAGHQTYDPYYSDYHRWNSAEDGFYRRWETETGRGHLDFGRRPVEEQRAYYGWRHQR